MISVTLHGVVEVEKREDGSLYLLLPSRELTSEEIKVLDSLFPHTTTHIDKALTIEALINATNK
jgi:hypothetical protein